MFSVRHVLTLFALATFACEAAPPTADDDGGWRPEWPEAEIRYETEHIRVAPIFQQPICQGSLDAMERHVLMVADMLGIEPGPVTVFWFNDEVEGADLDEPLGCLPCFKHGAVYSNWGSMMHEVVHGTVNPVLGRSDVTMTEGVANAFDGAAVTEPVTGPGPLPSELIGDTKQGGARFFRWLLDERGPDVIKELFAALPRGIGAEEGIAAFGEVLGEDLQAVEAEFLDTAPLVYPAPGLCDDLPEVAWEDGAWSIDTDVDCSASNVFGPTDPGHYSYEPDPHNFVAVVMNVPPEVVGREFEVIHNHPDTPIVDLVPCLEGPTDDLERAEVRGITASETFSGWVLPYAMRYRVEIPAGPEGRADLRLQLLE